MKKFIFGYSFIFFVSNLARFHWLIQFHPHEERSILSSKTKHYNKVRNCLRLSSYFFHHDTFVTRIMLKLPLSYLKISFEFLLMQLNDIPSAILFLPPLTVFFLLFSFYFLSLYTSTHVSNKERKRDDSCNFQISYNILLITVEISYTLCKTETRVRSLMEETMIFFL